jgi:transcription antitermination factor NusA-like protein
MMKADIDKGLKPSEALQVTFSEQDKERYNIKSRRTIARFIKKYLSTQALPYSVKSFERRETGSWVILVTVPPQRASRRSA